MLRTLSVTLSRSHAASKAERPLNPAMGLSVMKLFAIRTHLASHLIVNVEGNLIISALVAKIPSRIAANAHFAV